MVRGTDSLQWNALLFTGMVLSFFLHWTRAHRRPSYMCFLVWSLSTEHVTRSRDGLWAELDCTLNLRSEMVLSLYVVSSKCLAHIRKRWGHSWFKNLFPSSLQLLWLKYPVCLGMTHYPGLGGIYQVYPGAQTWPYYLGDTVTLKIMPSSRASWLCPAKEAPSSMGVLRKSLARLWKCFQMGRGSISSIC